MNARHKPDVGALERIDGAAVSSALQLACAGKGRVFDLGLEISSKIPHDPGFVRFARAFTHTPEGTGATSPFQFSAEMISGTLHTSTHIDAFIHVQKDGRIYGGYDAASSRDDAGWKRYGMETVPPIVGRAICLDIPGSKRLERLPDRYEITVEDLKLALSHTGLSVRSGDIVLVRTGKILDFGDERAFQSAEPGVGREAAIWLYDQGMAVLGTDTTGTEPLPFRDPTETTHVAMLVDRGVHLIENLYLEEVVHEHAEQGLFVAMSLKITGATGSWVRPVLIA